VSPLTVRRYRAERMLRKEFEALRGRVMATVRGRLRASGVNLDASDLEACYAQAWQGLYTAMLAGEEIVNPAGWLALVTFRRAIEEHRSRRRAYPTNGVGEPSPDGLRGGREADVTGGVQEHDFAGELDDRIRLRQLFEGLRGRLSAREQQAAALCYLQGLSRSEAAARMGISESRMRKLMEGSGAGRPGVAGKVGELVETIRGGGWCEEQGSLMRGFAFGILDPEGERYLLALAHWRECPACRAYILSLRGLAAVLPPVFLPGVLGAGALAGVGAGAGAHAGAQAGAGAGAAAGSGTGTGVGAGAGAGASAGVQAGPGIGGALSASGTAGAGAAGGGWMLAGGSVGAKLAVGCLVALSVGAGCVALSVSPDHGRVGRPANHHRHSFDAGATGAARGAGAAGGLTPGYVLTGAAPIGHPDGAAFAKLETSTPSLTPAGKASREFGPEQALARGAPSIAASSSSLRAPSARASSTGRSAAGGSTSGGSEEFTSAAAPTPAATPTTAAAPASSSQPVARPPAAGATTGGGGAAQREFGIG
jgi:DNA-directed RNA polymerase specialized sigma24 family protein